MYIRFETEQIDLRSGKPIGIFTLAYNLLRDNDFTPSQKQAIRDLMDYFEKELPVPNKFTTKKNNARGPNKPGTSWLHSEEREMVSHFWLLKSALEEHGYNIHVRIQARHPGKIIYSDRYQVVVV